MSMVKPVRRIRTFLLSILGISLAFGIGVLSAEAQSSQPLPTPSAAGTTPHRAKPLPAAEEVDDEDDEPVALDRDLPEPLLCLFRQERTQKGSLRWVNVGSDFPKIAPPVSKQELLSPAFSRYHNGSKTSWGTCSEVKVSKDAARLTVQLYGHVAKGRTRPDSLSLTECKWTSNPESQTERFTFELKVRESAGIQFRNLQREWIRFSIHWPEVTQTDTTGGFCRRFANEMNQKDFESKPNRFVLWDSKLSKPAPNPKSPAPQAQPEPTADDRGAIDSGEGSTPR